MSRETAWLIERADPDHPGHVLPNSFLGVAGHYDGSEAVGMFMWMSDAENAVRFTRREDAAKMIGAIMGLMNSLPHGYTMMGLRSGDVRALPVEHAWGDALVPFEPLPDEPVNLEGVPI